MKKLFALAAIFALAGCAPLLSMMTGIPASPSAVADKTVIDEQAALGVELGYQVAAQLVLTANMANLLDADMKVKLRDLDNRAYRAVLAARSAYKGGNAADYGAAASEARSAIGEILSVVKGN